MHTLRLHRTLLCLTLMSGQTGVAVAQSAATYDLAQLPAFHGKVAQYDLSPRGVDGLILEDGTEVHTDRGLDDALVAAIKPGDTVTIHGLKARALNLVQAMSITNDATSATVADRGDGDGRHGGRDGGRGHRGGSRDDDKPADLHGQIRLQLHDESGAVDGVLLDDRTIVLIPTAAVAKLSDGLAPGHTIFVHGELGASALGKVLVASTIGQSANQMVALPNSSHGHDGRGDRDSGDDQGDR